MNIFKKKPEFVAIGDTVIDAFIRLKDAHETVNKETQKNELCMIFGTKLPFESAEEVVAVGNSANAAVSASRLGLSSGLISHLGDDENGRKCLAKLKSDGVDTRYIEIHKGLKTNYHYVLWFGSERTILIKHEDFPLTLPDISGSKWLYLSSLSEKSLDFHQHLADYLDKNPGIKLVFQPGTYQIKFGTEKLKMIYERSELFFCNLEEAQIILNNNTSDVRALLEGLKALGPKLPVITDGPNGSYVINEADQLIRVPIYPDIAPPVDRTGAGDAFASTFSTAIALGKTREEAMKWGSINSMSVCQHVGAQAGLLPLQQIEKYIAAAPATWTAEIL
ncbi:MAG TPA: carbohydrate kinase family protein [Candidatus Paceibacterota bacterium]